MEKKVNKSAQMYDLIKLWRSSGMTKKAFCESHNVNIHTFTYWIEKERYLEPSGSFVEVAARHPESYVEFLFPQGAVLRVGSDISISQMSLLKTLLY
jgi:hypothetical protein